MTDTITINNITPPRVPLVDEAGLISRPWFMWLLNMFARAGADGDSIATLTGEVDGILVAPVAPEPIPVILDPQSVAFAGANGQLTDDPLFQFGAIENHLSVGTTLNHDPYFGTDGFYAAVIYEDESDAALLDAAYASSGIATLYSLWNFDDLDGNLTGQIVGSYSIVANPAGGSTRDIGSVIAQSNGAYYDGTGTLDDVTAGYNSANASGGAQVTEVRGTYSYASAEGAASAVGTLVGVEIEIANPDATVTDAVGLLVLDVDGVGTNDYAIKTGLGAVDFGDFIQLTEETAPAAPASNKVRIYAQDNGAGKTQLMARFATGAAQQIALQP
jgi:hypothetical protein